LKFTENNILQSGKLGYMKYQTLQEWVEIFERRQMIFKSVDYGETSIAMAVS